MCDRILPRTQIHPPNGIISNFRNKSPARSRPVDGAVVTEYQHAVRGQRQIYFYNVDPHFDSAADGRE